MEKTKLGISAALMSVILFCVAYFGGYIAAIILAGYILICEESVWLKKMAVKCIIIMLCFSVIYEGANILPSLISDMPFMPSVIDTVVSLISKIINYIIDYAEIAVYVLMVIFSFNHKTLRLPLVDNILDKHFGA